MTHIRSMTLVLLCLFFLVLLLCHTETAMDGVRQGLSLCTETLFPSLFPFLVLSELLVTVGAGALLGKLFGRPVRAIFGLSHAGASVFLLGTVCGLPIGTTTAVALFERGEMTQRELERVVLFCNNPSSGFLIAAVGVGLFGSKEIGIALFCITLLSSFLLGIALRLGFGAIQIAPKSPDGVEKRLIVGDFTNGVRRAFFSLLGVCSFVLFFSAVSRCLGTILSSFRVPSAVETLIYGTLEMTSGISHAVVALPPALAFRAVCFFSAFAGISVSFQVLCAAEDTGVRLLPYLLAKLLQGAISLLLAECYLRLFCPTLTPTQSVQTLVVRGGYQAFVLALFLFLGLWIFESLFVKRKKASL